MRRSSGAHRSVSAAPRVRLAVGAVLAAIAIVLGAVAIPAQSTLASFTDAETAAANPSMKAGTLGTASVTSCSMSGSRIQLAWSKSPGSIPNDGSLVRFTDVVTGNIIDFQVGGASAAQIRVNAAAGFTANHDYRVNVFLKLSTAPNWTSVAGTTALFHKGQGNGNNTCA